MEFIFAIIIIGLGALHFVGAVRNQDWLMNTYKARHIVDALGEKGARIVYGFIGIFLLVVGTLFLGASL